jgi:hypothetical protein
VPGQMRGLLRARDVKGGMLGSKASNRRYLTQGTLGGRSEAAPESALLAFLRANGTGASGWSTIAG